MRWGRGSVFEEFLKRSIVKAALNAFSSLREKCPNTDQKKLCILDTFHAELIFWQGNLS